MCYGAGAPWKKIFAAAESVGGAEYYLMEQAVTASGTAWASTVFMPLDAMDAVGYVLWRKSGDFGDCSSGFVFEI